MILILWLAACIAAVLVLNGKRPHWYWALVLVSYVIFPNVSKGFYVPFLHPAGWAVLVGYVFTVFVYPNRIRHWFHESRYLLMAMSLVMLVASLDVLSPYGGGLKGTTSFLLTILLLPLLLGVAIRGTLRVDPRREKVYLWLFMLTMVFEAVLSFFQYATKKAIFFTGALQSVWFAQQGGDLSRSSGTTTLGMQLATLLVIAMLITLRMRSVLVRMSLTVLFALAIPGTNARAQFITGSVAFAIVLIVSLRQRFLPAVVGGAAAVIGFVYYVQNSKAGTELIQKFSQDGGSKEKRVQAYTWFLNHMPEMIWQGYPGSRAMRESGVLTSTLENGYLMFALNFGVVLGVVYLLIQIVTLISRTQNNLSANYPAILAAVFTMVTVWNSSSFMAEAPEGPLLWALIGLASVRKLTAEERQQEVAKKLACGRSRQRATAVARSVPQLAAAR